MDIREEVRKLIDEGWSLVPIPKGSKAPTAKDWVNRTFSVEDFEAESNVGVRLGKPSGNLVDVDLDCPEAVIAAKMLLPPTERKHGRPGTGDSHYWYVAEGVKSERWLDTEGKVLVEIRSTGGQTVIPPSIHPSGEELYWAAQRSPGTPDPALLPRAGRSTATAALLGRHWPAGNRHFCAQHASGFLASRGLDPQEIEEIVGAAATIAKDDEVADRRRFARDTAKTFKAGGKTTGAPTLEASIGKAVVALLLKWYGGNEAVHSKLIETMNARHFVVTIGKDAVIGDEADGELALRSERTMHLLYANKIVKTGQRKKKGEPKEGETEVAVEMEDLYKTHYEIWRKHPERREFRRLSFSPPPAVPHPRDYNLWRGFGVLPLLPPEDHPARKDEQALAEWVRTEVEPLCARYLELTHDVICGGEPERQEEYYEYLLDLLALTVQQPGIPSEVAVVLKGKRGAGKGMFVRNFGTLFGQHFAQISKPEQIVGKFNASCSGKVVIFADEAFYAGDKRDLGALKVLITEPWIAIERKGIDPVQEPNYVHLFMASNEDWNTPAGFQERRFFVLSVSDVHMQDHDYFSKLTQELKNGGQAALLTYLLHRRITPERREALRQAPRTEELRAQQERSLDTEMRWWRERLLQGTLGITGSEWPLYIRTCDLFDDYINWCDKMKVNRRLPESILIRDILRPWLGKQTRTTSDDGNRINKRELLELDKARALFDEKAGTKGSWTGEVDAPEGSLGTIPDDRIPF